MHLSRAHSISSADYREMFPQSRFKVMADETRRKISSDLGRSQKIRERKLEFWERNRGRSIEAMRGKESADRTKSLLSQRMSGKFNPSYGKVPKKAGGRNVGWYKGLIFRSLWEYSFLKGLERKGVDLSTGVECESHMVKFQFDGKNRSFRPDFHVVGMGIVEIKSVYETTIGPQKRLNDSKFSAAREHFDRIGLGFTVLTERDFHVLSKASALRDPDIRWIRK